MTAPRGPVARGAPYTPDISSEATLVDLLDRLLAGGVMVCGEVVLCIADVPLVRVDLRALIAPAAPGHDPRDRDAGNDDDHLTVPGELPYEPGVVVTDASPDPRTDPRTAPRSGRRT